MLQGPAAARSQAVRVTPAYEVSFSPFYQQNSWEQRRGGESCMRKHDTAESAPVSSSVPGRARIFPFFLFLSIFSDVNYSDINIKQNTCDV